MKLRITSFVITVFIAFIFIFSASQTEPTQAGAANFGSGINVCPAPISPVTPVSPKVVTNCTQAGIQAALNGGGHITFSCGANPVTIPISSQLNLKTDGVTVIDGGGLVTLDGQNSTRILNKEWSANPANITIQNMRFINAKAPSGAGSGGAIRVGYSGTKLHIINSTFENNNTTDMNTPDNKGGAIFVHNSAETIISGSVFENNAAGNGGAFGGIGTDLIVFNSYFNNNRATDNASGGIVRGYGGALNMDGVDKNFNLGSNDRMHVCGTHFENNRAIRGGGAIDIVFSDNYNTRLLVQKSSFIDNEVTGLNGQYGQGGAIYLVEDEDANGFDEDNIEITDSTFHGNLAGRQGGAVWWSISGRGRVVNSTFEGNSTTAPFNSVGQGGAMAIGGTVEIINSTFANNHASYQGGAIHGGGSNNAITLKNTIFLNNTLNIGQTVPSDTRWQGFHTNRPMIDGGQNIQEPRYKPTYNNDHDNWVTTNPIFQDPLLQALADNGGPTLTMALSAASPAIDNGAAGCPATDQRGELRDDEQCDIGAYEYVISQLEANPSSQSVFPGGVATYQIQILSSDAINQPLNLVATESYPDISVSLSQPTILPGQTATLTVTDSRSGTLSPGVWHTISLTGTNSNLSLETEVTLLVGGERTFLPVILR